MTRHTAGVARRAVRNAGMVRGSLLLGLLLLTFPLSGCSILIYHAYKEAAIAQGYDWMEISALETRGEVHEKLGKPADAFSCPEGTRLDSYHLPGKINPCVQFKFKSHSSCGPLDEASDAFGIVLLGVRSLGISELVMTPMVLWEAHKAEQARAEWHVAFVYDAEDHILYRYDAAPGDEEGVVLGPLTHQVQYFDTPRCPSWRDCVGRGVAETRRCATCLGYTLPPEAAQRVEWAERIAEEVDADRLSRKGGWEALSSCYLKSGGPCPFAPGTGSAAPE